MLVSPVVLRKLMKLKTIITLIIIFIAIVAIIFGVFAYRFLNLPLISAGKSAVDVTLMPGGSVKTVAVELKNKGIWYVPVAFVWLAHHQNVAHKIKAGEYRIDPGITTASKLLEKMVKGDAIMHEVKIIEGWNFKQLLAAINKNPFLVHTINGRAEAEIMKRISLEGKAAEGIFAPDTYRFSGLVEDITILKLAHQLMRKRLTTEWQMRAPETNYKCPYEALIVASMIEKETAINAEKPQIAGVILRRLQKKMPLQIDATVIYALGEMYTGKLSIYDLKRASSYNTYMRLGVPPTPIAAPGVDSLHAALHPAPGTALYYVAKEDGGEHVFSDTLPEHNTAVEQYLVRKKQNGKATIKAAQ